MNPGSKNPDDFKQTWQGQPRTTVDVDPLLNEVRRKERRFATEIFWRDVREIGSALIMAPLWIYLGVKTSSPWAFYLTAPVLLWIAVYMLVDRKLHQRQPSEPAEPLRRRLESSLAEVEHQIKLLRNVRWWALLPMSITILAFLGQSAWRERGGGWWTALAFSMTFGLVLGAFSVIYWLNLYAVRARYEPRRLELKTLLMSLEDEKPPEGS